MKKIYYKVVKPSDYGLFQSSYEYDTVVYYELGKWIDAPEFRRIPTRLFVFDNLGDARAFRFCGDKIFECEVKGGIKGRGCHPIDRKSFWKKLNDCTKRKKSTKPVFTKYTNSFYSPAILVKSVKLIREICEI